MGLEKQSVAWLLAGYVGLSSACTGALDEEMGANDWMSDDREAGVMSDGGTLMPWGTGTDPGRPDIVQEDTECAPGTTVLRRLNRAELGNTLVDLFAVDVNLDPVLPDPTSGGFNTIADILVVLPDGLKRYERVFEETIDTLLADSTARATLIACEQESRDCLAETLSSALPRIWRREVGEAERVALVEQALGVFDEHGFDDALRIGLKTALMSASFIYRTELPPAQAEGAFPLGNYETANRLSYFLWSSMPDEQLFERAATAKLGDPAVLQAEVSRMLDDPRASALLDNFVTYWLQLYELDGLDKDLNDFPGWDEELRSSIRLETRLFMRAAIHEKWPINKLLTSNEAFINERLARHYGMELAGSSLDSGFYRVPRGDGLRGGLLSQASILSLTSPPTADHFAVIRRGQWVLEQLLCQPPPPPPDGVEGLMNNEAIDLSRPVKEVLSQHRSDPSCAVCHTDMDPIGFGLEVFSWTGVERQVDAHGNPVDATGQLPDGSQFNGPVELAALLAEGGRFTRCSAQNVFVYALGRVSNELNSCIVANALEGLNPEVHSLQDLIARVVTSDAFLFANVQEETL